ncbi:hypothetical protein DVH05_020235 [Phytophthora capsici]|nr:hypothetical protein DVH05_020235 [Phytophthora capsici]
MSEASFVQGVDVVGCDVGDGGRSCGTHDICGQHLKVDDTIVFRAEVVCVDEGDINGDLEYILKAYVIRGGSQACHVGFLPRRLLRKRAVYNNKMATVVEDLRTSENSQKRRRSERSMGIVRCLLLSDVEEHFRA